jgi:hypothetical protein
MRRGFGVLLGAGEGMALSVQQLAPTATEDWKETSAYTPLGLRRDPGSNGRRRRGSSPGKSTRTAQATRSDDGRGWR